MKKGKEDISIPIESVRHSLAHILAMAVRKKFPEAKLGIGPTIENGFYYDFLLPRPLAPEDLAYFTKEMRLTIKKNLAFKGEPVTFDEAKRLFEAQTFKEELIDELAKEGKELSVYYTGNDFFDLCRGGHIENTREINPDAFVLTKIAGAYWKGDEASPQLQRIYGVAFRTKEELEQYLAMIEEAQKRDHKKLGPKLEIFMFHDTAPGMPYWLPKGVLILNKLVEFWREEHTKRGYKEIKSPLLNKKELYETSGHWEHYQENMFIAQTDEDEIYALKPMNCPNAMVVFANKKHSYRELPLRFSDTDTLHRYERSGTLQGLLRVREFSQDDAHIFVTEDQVSEEYENIFDIVERFYSVFDLSYSFRLGTRPEKYMGVKEDWDKAEKELREILEKSNKPYIIQEGDGAFYGPKIDILMKDSLGREWQMGTVQLDFQIPKRFGLTYIDSEGKEKSPIVIHRVIYGSLERFMGILIEHYAGAFPFWLAPVQVKILSVSEKQKDYAENVYKKLAGDGIRVEISPSNETLGKRIREAEMERVPYILIIGEREVGLKTVAVWERDKGDIGSLTLEEFFTTIKIIINP